MKLYRYLNYIRVRSFIPTGAPFAYKTPNIAVRGLSACDCCLQQILAADDPNGPIVYLHRIDDRGDVSLSRCYIARFEPFVHQPREGVNLGRVDGHGRSGLRACPIKRGFRLIAFLFERCRPLAQNIVQFDDAVLDRAVKPAQSVLTFGKLAL